MSTIKYGFHRMRVGQRRFISDEGNSIDKAMKSVYAWRKRGYDLKTTKTSFGMIVELLSVPLSTPTRGFL